MRHFLIVLLLPSVALAGDKKEPSIRFARCDGTKKHIAVQVKDGSCMVHLHLDVRNCAKKTVFVRVRCVCDAEGDRRDYLDTREVTINGETERWRFYLNAPKFDSDTEATYQIELGVKDLTAVDEYYVLDTFAWKLRKGEMYTGTKDNPVSIDIPKRVVEIEGKSFKIRTGYQTTVSTKMGELEYGFVKQLPHSPVKGDNWAEKISEGRR